MSMPPLTHVLRTAIPAHHQLCRVVVCFRATAKLHPLTYFLGASCYGSGFGFPTSLYSTNSVHCALRCAREPALKKQFFCVLMTTGRREKAKALHW